VSSLARTTLDRSQEQDRSTRIQSYAKPIAQGRSNAAGPARAGLALELARGESDSNAILYWHDECKTVRYLLPRNQLEDEEMVQEGEGQLQLQVSRISTQADTRSPLQHSTGIQSNK